MLVCPHCKAKLISDSRIKSTLELKNIPPTAENIETFREFMEQDLPDTDSLYNSDVLNAADQTELFRTYVLEGSVPQHIKTGTSTDKHRYREFDSSVNGLHIDYFDKKDRNNFFKTFCIKITFNFSIFTRYHKVF